MKAEETTSRREAVRNFRAFMNANCPGWERSMREDMDERALLAGSDWEWVMMKIGMVDGTEFEFMVIANPNRVGCEEGEE